MNKQYVICLPIAALQLIVLIIVSALKNSSNATMCTIVQVITAVLCVLFVCAPIGTHLFDRYKRLVGRSSNVTKRVHFQSLTVNRPLLVVPYESPTVSRQHSDEHVPPVTIVFSHRTVGHTDLRQIGATKVRDFLRRMFVSEDSSNDAKVYRTR